MSRCRVPRLRFTFQTPKRATEGHELYIHSLRLRAEPNHWKSVQFAMGRFAMAKPDQGSIDEYNLSITFFNRKGWEEHFTLLNL